MISENSVRFNGRSRLSLRREQSVSVEKIRKNLLEETQNVSTAWRGALARIEKDLESMSDSLSAYQNNGKTPQGWNRVCENAKTVFNNMPAALQSLGKSPSAEDSRFVLALLDGLKEGLQGTGWRLNNRRLGRNAEVFIERSRQRIDAGLCSTGLLRDLTEILRSTIVDVAANPTTPAINQNRLRVLYAMLSHVHQEFPELDKH